MPEILKLEAGIFVTTKSPSLPHLPYDCWVKFCRVQVDRREENGDAKFCRHHKYDEHHWIIYIMTVK